MATSPVTELEATPDAAREKPSPRAAASGSLYRLIWRWHFYAGIFVTPVLFIVALTGAAYVFRSEIEDWGESGLRFVTPGPTRLGAQEIVDAVRSGNPKKSILSLELSADPRRAALVLLEGAPGPGTLVAVDPYQGSILGSFDGPRGSGLVSFFDLVLTLHRTLFLGTIGRLIVELTVGWTIVLLVSGLYLWWPKRAGKAAGVWKPRLGAKLYTILRDLHALSGFYLLVPAMVIVVTGLFYAIVWGEAFYYVTGSPVEPPPAAQASGRPLLDPQKSPALSLDQIEALARSRYPGRNLWFLVKGDGGRGIAVRATSDFSNSYGPFDSAQFTLDRFDGRLLDHKTLADGRYWWHGWVYPLHVGSILGPTTKVLWFLTCLVLCALPVTGLWMWLRRRPVGKTGFPRRPDMPVPVGVTLSIIALGLAMPVVGLSMLLILGGERLYQAVRPGV